MVSIYNYKNFGNRKFKFISGESIRFIIRFKKVSLKDKNIYESKENFPI